MMQSNPLFQAVASVDAQSVRRLLEDGIPAETQRGDGLTPLLLAAGMNDNLVNIMMTLVGYGADVESRDQEGRTPLLRCAGRNVANLA